MPWSLVYPMEVSRQISSMPQVELSQPTYGAVAAGGPSAVPSAVSPAGGASGSSGSDPVAIALQALRGRYWITLLLALIGGIAGGIAGWRLSTPLYRSTGLVRISNFRTPVVTSVDERSGQAYDAMMKTQEAILSSRPFLVDVLDSPEWRQTGRGDSTAVAETFGRLLSARRIEETEHLQVTLDDADPNVAAAGVRAVVNTYSRTYRERSEGELHRKLAVLDERVRALEGQLKTLNTTIRSITEDVGTENLDELISAAARRAAMLESRQMDVRLALAGASHEPGAPSVPDRVAPGDASSMAMPELHLTVAEIEQMDPGMHELIAAQIKISDQLEMLKTVRHLGSNHPDVVRLAWELQKSEEHVDAYAERFRQTQALLARYPAHPGTQAVAHPQSVQALQADELLFNRLVAETKHELNTLETKRGEIAPYKSEITSIQAELTAKRARKEILETEAALGDNLEIINSGEVPIQPYYNPRKKMVPAAALAGASFPVALLLLLGVARRRYRFSDEAERDVSTASSAPLLGIIPDISSWRRNPEQLADAAQCIHRMRTMLQVGRPQQKQGVFLVTSSAPGEGKTSVALSLAMSFVASGCRTLLIDSDLVGQRLTRGLHARAWPGLVDSLRFGTIKGYARRTQGGFFFLPTGTSDMLEAATISSGEMHQLLQDARGYFDAIVLDSGPVLGSVEATAVAAQTDGVIFVVSRGQQPALVDRALRHVRSIQAVIVGLIFNRAQSRDFNQSTYASSLRSIPSPSATGRSALPTDEMWAEFGPLVAAVASLMPSLRTLSPTTELVPAGAMGTST